MKTQVLQSGLEYLQLVGLWGERPRPVYRYFALLSFEVAFLFIPKILFGLGEEGFDSFACNLAELIFIGEVAVSFALFNCRSRSFEKLVANLRTVVERLDAEPSVNGTRKSIGKIERFCSMYTTYVWIVMMIYGGIPPISSLVIYFSKSEGERDEFMVYFSLYWMDIRHNILHYGIYFVVVFLACTCSAYQSILKVTAVSAIVQYGAVMFEFTTQKIKRLAELAEQDERRKELREIIEIHKLALEYAAHLERTVSFFLLNQMSCCVLMMCLMMYYVTTSFGTRAVNIILMIIIMMGEMGLHCFYGSKLSEKAAEVGNVMYAHAWYLEAVDVQKDMQLIIARSQRPTAITAGKFYFVNIERFAIVNQASYSYYLILKNTF
ncbi:odorant receptor 4-like [Sabethes cyaneus]|uniref:odorant receptor 4-like n=1 Tax=Sabethes cyaneus TaxID=53552 RepID=UPI00237E65A3|nr:odorant receptor 4-like [Sabethes cyaneus]